MLPMAEPLTSMKELINEIIAVVTIGGTQA